MSPNLMFLAGVALAAVLFGMMAVLTLRLRQTWLRWPAFMLALILAGLCLLVGGLDLRGQMILNSQAANSVAEVQVSATPDQIARGERIAHICAVCHSTNGQLPLSGSQVSLFGESPTLGTLYAPNLTPGGSIKDWSDGQIIRAIREGVDDGNLPLMIMPAGNYHAMSDADVQAVVAYLRSQPAVDNPVPERALGWLANIFVGGGLLVTSQQVPLTDAVTAPVPGLTADYGHYLVTIYACSSCHGDNLAGKAPGQGPAGSNLTELIPKMTPADFIQKIRATKNNAQGMPYEQISAASTDDDLAAMYLFLHGLRTLPTVTP